MAYISNVTLLDGNNYDLKDAEAAKVVSLTQAEYDALTNPDPNVTYFITDSDDYGADKVDITLYAANWSSAVYTIADEHIDTDTVQLIIPKEGITDTQLEALQGANIQAYGQTTGELYLKAYGDVPEIDIPVSVIFHPGVQVKELEQQKQEIYSTNETVVGTWIDGKPIYRRVFSVNIDAQVYTITHGISNLDMVINAYGFTRNASGDHRPMTFAAYGTMAWMRSFEITLSQIIIESGSDINSSQGSYRGHLILEYTKTTD